jgi:hypothetical protein
LFFFDPVREQERGGAYEHFLDMITYLTFRYAEAAPQAAGSPLPHRVAVCVSKLDDPKVFAIASSRQLLSKDGNGMPAVAGKNSERFFDLLCRTTGGNAMHLQDAIRQNFAPERVRYFTISSAGFYLGRSMRFDPQDYQNVVYDDNHAPRLRGTYIRPVNLLQPLLWLSASSRGPSRNRRTPREATRPAAALAQRSSPVAGLEAPDRTSKDW